MTTRKPAKRSTGTRETFRTSGAALVSLALLVAGLTVSPTAHAADSSDDPAVVASAATEAATDEYAGGEVTDNPAEVAASAKDEESTDQAAFTSDEEAAASLDTSSPRNAEYPLPPSPAAAIEPQVSSSTADIVVRAGGDRDVQGNIEGLNGVVFGLFATQTGSEALYTAKTATYGTLTGIAHFRNVNVSPARSLWVRAISAPDGWSLNETFGTAPLSAAGQVTTVNNRNFTFRVPQTSGNLAANTVYASWTDSLSTVERTALGISTSGIAVSRFMSAPTTIGTSDARFTGSLGVWPLSRINNYLLPRCDATLRVALIIDQSMSVQLAGTAAEDQMREAATGLLGALQNPGSPPTVFRAYGFGTTATTIGSQVTLNVSAGSTAQEIASLRNTLNGISFPRSGDGGFTNWDHALRQVRTGYDLVVFLTDGLPSVLGTTGSTSGGSGVTRFAENEAAVFSANAVKASGTRIEVVAVGDASLSTAGAQRNMIAISGSDAVQTGTFDHAADLLRSAAYTACTPSLLVTKQVQTVNGILADRVGWPFEASIPTPAGQSNFAGFISAEQGTTITADTVERPAGATSSGGTGRPAATFAFDVPDGVPTTWTGGAVTVREQMLPGYTHVPESDGLNAQCNVSRNGEQWQTASAVNVKVSNAEESEYGPGVTLTRIGTRDVVHCVFTNREPEIGGGKYASLLSVHKSVVSPDVDPVNGHTPFDPSHWNVTVSAVDADEDQHLLTTKPSSQDMPIGIEDVEVQYRITITSDGHELNAKYVTGDVLACKASVSGSVEAQADGDSSWLVTIPQGEHVECELQSRVSYLSVHTIVIDELNEPVTDASLINGNWQIDVVSTLGDGQEELPAGLESFTFTFDGSAWLDADGHEVDLNFIKVRPGQAYTVTLRDLEEGTASEYQLVANDRWPTGPNNVTDCVTTVDSRRPTEPTSDCADDGTVTGDSEEPQSQGVFQSARLTGFAALDLAQFDLDMTLPGFEGGEDLSTTVTIEGVKPATAHVVNFVLTQRPVDPEPQIPLPCPTNPDLPADSLYCVDGQTPLPPGGNETPDDGDDRGTAPVLPVTGRRAPLLAFTGADVAWLVGAVVLLLGGGLTLKRVSRRKTLSEE